MRIVPILAILLLMFGCSHFNADTNKHSELDHNQEVTMGTKRQEVRTDKININNYSIQNLKSQVLAPDSTGNEDNLVSTNPKKSSTILNVNLIRQNPELRYGCEVTSLAMILNYAGVKTTKMDLYQSIQKDSDPIVRSRNGDILKWGNPADGFVGDMTGRKAGYAVFDKPMIALINQKLPGRAVNLTNQPFDKVLEHVSEGYPVVVWTTGDYRLPDRWEGWYHGNQFIKTPLDLHAVVLVGYDHKYVYLNDPLSGKKQVRVEKEQFIASWKALQNRAVSYK